MTTRRGTLPALAAVAALAGAGDAGRLPAQAPAQRSAPAPTVREYVGEKKHRLPGKKKKETRSHDPLRPYKWVHYRNGDAIDGRGDFRSAKREQRRQLCALYGVTTGRQWVRLRRALRRTAGAA